jgi:hypothetical protein
VPPKKKNEPTEGDLSEAVTAEAEAASGDVTPESAEPDALTRAQRDGVIRSS